jgi:LemA protein
VHERATREAVIRARNAYDASREINDKAKADTQVAGALGQRFAVAERYPYLEANQEFLAGQQHISVLESTIADRGEFKT